MNGQVSGSFRHDLPKADEEAASANKRFSNYVRPLLTRVFPDPMSVG